MSFAAQIYLISFSYISAFLPHFTALV